MFSPEQGTVHSGSSGVFSENRQERWICTLARIICQNYKSNYTSCLYTSIQTQDQFCIEKVHCIFQNAA